MNSSAIKKRTLIASLTILFVLVVDQIIKVTVKTNMLLHEQIEITSWFKICFVENEGMAFGMDFVGTAILSVFRIFAVAFFTYLLVKVIKKKYPTGFVFCFALVIAGAAGNIIDNCLYGLIFDKSDPVFHVFAEPAHFVPLGEGYGDFLSGKVVDMFYFPLFVWPDSIPWLGGKVFFSAIFNFADAAISCGAVALVLFYYPYLSKSVKGEENLIKTNEE